MSKTQAIADFRNYIKQNWDSTDKEAFIADLMNTYLTEDQVREIVQLKGTIMDHSLYVSNCNVDHENRTIYVQKRALPWFDDNKELIVVAHDNARFVFKLTNVLRNAEGVPDVYLYSYGNINIKVDHDTRLVGVVTVMVFC